MGIFRKSKPVEEMSDKDIEKAASKSIKKEDWENAETYLRALIDRKPDYGGAYTELATCLMHLERKDEAKEILESAVKVAPEDKWVLATSGILLSTVGNEYQKAVEYIEKAKSLGLKDRNVDAVLKTIKHNGWAFLKPTTGDHVLEINRTIDLDIFDPVEDPEIYKALEAMEIQTEGNVVMDITPQLKFIAEIAHEAIEKEKQVSMRDLCQKAGIIAGEQGAKDVVKMSGRMHGFKAEYFHLETEDILATFSLAE
jgi:tetratricopeptide (TPR) repeat protein